MLGEHPLTSRDDSSREHMLRLMDGQPVNLVNTKPPHNADVERCWNQAIAAGFGRATFFL